MNSEKSRLGRLTDRIISLRSKQISSIRNDTQKHHQNGISDIIRFDVKAIRSNRNILLNIQKSVVSISNVVSKNTTDTVNNPFDIFNKRNSDGIGLGLGAAILGKLFSTIGAPLITLLGKGLSLAKRVADFVSSRLGTEDDEYLEDEDSDNRRKRRKSKIFRRIKTFARKTTRSIRRHVPRLLSKVTTGAVRFAPQIISRLGLMMTGAAAAAGSALTGTAAGVALLSAAVGFASYKIGRWFNLSDRLDSLIAKASNNKFRDLADILLGITDGSIASDIGTWVKDNILVFFNRGYEFIRSKVSNLLEKLNPFSGSKQADAQTLSNKSNNASELNKAVENINTKNNSTTSEDSTEVVNSGDTGSGSGSPTPTHNNQSIPQTITSKASSVFNSAVDTVSSGIDSVGSVVSSVIDKGKDVISSGIDTVSDFIFGESPEKNYKSNRLTYFPTKEKNLNSAFGMRKHPVYGDMRMHTGVDIAVSTGTTVFSAGSGTVHSVGTRGDYGKTVEIDHGNGLRTLYAHLSDYSISKGKSVTAGQPIAKSGNTGTSTAPHLHFEVINNGKKENPVKHFGFTGKTVMGSDGYSRKPTPEEQRKGIGGVSSVRQQLPSITNTKRTTLARKFTQSSKPISDTQSSSTTYSTEIQSTDVLSPRLYDRSIELSTRSILYT